MPRPPTDKEQVREQMLQATEVLLKKYGPGRVTVSDVAAVCGMSQSNAYRFFPSKKALIEAGVTRWFKDIDAELDAIANSDDEPEACLLHFLLRLYELKRERYEADPELFAACMTLAEDNMEAVEVHLQRIHEMRLRIVERCIEAGVFKGTSSSELAKLIELLTVSFSNPWIIMEQSEKLTPEWVKTALATLIFGLKARFG